MSISDPPSLKQKNSDTVREYLRPKINEYLEKSLAHRKEKNPALYETMKSDLLESYLRFGVLDRVFNFAKPTTKTLLYSMNMVHRMAYVRL